MNVNNFPDKPRVIADAGFSVHSVSVVHPYSALDPNPKTHAYSLSHPPLPHRPCSLRARPVAPRNTLNLISALCSLPTSPY